MTALYTAIYEVGKKAVEVFEGTATGGSATTLIDTALVSTNYDYHNGSLIVFLSGATGLIGTTKVVTDYVDTSRTFTFATGTAIAAGNRYAIIRNTASRGMIVNAINSALAEIGPYTQTDDTLTVTADTEEYALPAGVMNVVQVQVADDDSEPWGWKTYYQWIESAGNLIFLDGTYPATAGKHIRLYYNAPHAEVSLDADVIADAIAPARLYWTAAAILLGQIMHNGRNTSQGLKDEYNYAAQKAQEMAARYPIRIKARTPIYSTLGK